MYNDTKTLPVTIEVGATDDDPRSFVIAHYRTIVSRDGFIGNYLVSLAHRLELFRFVWTLGRLPRSDQFGYLTC